MTFRVYHQQRGAHVHLRFFAGTHDGAMAKCGDLCMRVEEFEIFMRSSPNIQFHPEHAR